MVIYASHVHVQNFTNEKSFFVHTIIPFDKIKTIVKPKNQLI